MRRQLLPLILITIGFSSFSQPWSDRVQALLDQMTLKEKVGQMTQVTVDMICNGEPYAIPVPFETDPEKVNKAVVEYGVGSILNVPSNNYPGVDAYRNLISEIQDAAGSTRLKIPVLYGLDHIHGVSYIKGGTLFPQPLAQACTWSKELVEQMGKITAYESRAAGVPWSFSPAMDIGRNPEWPRLWESFGEDVLMNKVMGSAMLKGFQGDNPADKDKIAACLKHFTGYGMPLSGKDRTPAWIPERYLREYYLPQYQEAINNGAITIMVNSGEINGIPTHADKHLLTDILRDEMGFKGLLVTDWQDIHYLYDRHHIAGDLKEAVKLAVEAGIDMSMTPVTYDFADLLIELVKEGTISESRIDLSAGRILMVKEALGLFDRTIDPLADFSAFGSDAHQQVSLEAAVESVVLLKNERTCYLFPNRLKCWLPDRWQTVKVP
ncbi:MAG: glycoside hydrolase family 3 protein [Saprospiraceae bacterium]|nr:glycoside hydrolase family 3 protein [Saprospiraceae bacterium]